MHKIGERKKLSVLTFGDVKIKPGLCKAAPNHRAMRVLLTALCPIINV